MVAWEDYMDKFPEGGQWLKGIDDKLIKRLNETTDFDEIREILVFLCRNHIENGRGKTSSKIDRRILWELTRIESPVFYVLKKRLKECGIVPKEGCDRYFPNQCDKCNYCSTFIRPSSEWSMYYWEKFRKQKKANLEE